MRKSLARGGLLLAALAALAGSCGYKGRLHTPAEIAKKEEKEAHKKAKEEAGVRKQEQDAP